MVELTRARAECSRVCVVISRETTQSVFIIKNINLGVQVLLTNQLG